MHTAETKHLLSSQSPKAEGTCQLPKNFPSESWNNSRKEALRGRTPLLSTSYQTGTEALKGSPRCFFRLSFAQNLNAAYHMVKIQLIKTCLSSWNLPFDLRPPPLSPCCDGQALSSPNITVRLVKTAFLHKFKNSADSRDESIYRYKNMYIIVVLCPYCTQTNIRIL